MGEGLKRAFAAARVTRSKKLTGPQQALLADIRGEARYVSDTYAPALKLVEMGYAMWHRQSYSTLLKITEEGRAALN